MKVKVKAVVSGTTRPMKDSGVEWIGLIPEKWSVYPARFAFSEEKTKNVKGTIKHALKFFNGTIIPKDGFDADFDEYVAETISNYTVVKPNTIMINGLNLNYDLKSLRVGLVNELGVITSAYLALIPDTSRILPTYATYLFKGYETKMAFHNMGSGIRKTLGFKEFKHQPILMPPLEEQAIISNYLDKECARIDSVIEKTRESIEEYKKLKQSIITEAVTKGIRPNREMKDSENEWIGRIPKDWEITRLKYVVDESFKGFGITKEEVFQDGETPCVRYGEIYSKYSISFENSFSMTKKNVLSTTRWFSYGDVLCAGTGELIEEIGKSIVYLGKERCLAGGDIIVLRHSQNPLFMGYLLNSAYVQEQRSCGKTKLKVVHISEPEIKNVWIAVPPIEEQIEIATWLHDKCDSIDLVIKNKEFELTELLKYKKSLIYEYVTGKKEVPSC